MEEGQLSNVLIHQKDYLYSLVNEEKFEEAVVLLEFVKEFWYAAEYGYKYEELRNKIIDRVRQHVIDADHWKTIQKWESFYTKLISPKEQRSGLES